MSDSEKNGCQVSSPGRAGRGRSLTILTAMVVATGVLLPDMAGADAGAPACRQTTLDVALAPLLPRDQTVAGELCLPAEGSTPSGVQVLVHGITYTGTYWDFPDPNAATDRYSYVTEATGAGFATLAIDRIGNGASSHPLGALVTLVTLDSNVYVLHQVISALRAGTLSGPGGPVSFAKVILVGHSYGSWVLWFEATRYRDADAIILTGISHQIPLDAPILVVSSLLQPAFLDPVTAQGGYDPTYLTTVPGTRYEAFYQPADVDPAVVAFDEANKGVVNSFEIANFPVILTAPLDIRVPVLLVNGVGDRLFCNPGSGGTDCSSPESLVAAEAPRLGHRVPCIEAEVVSDAGHVLNQVRNNQDWFAAAQDFAERTVGAGSGPPPGCAG